MNGPRIHPLCAMSPGMSAAQFAEFMEDIRINGQREPVKIWQGQIIDGRHRAEACRQVGVNLKTMIVNIAESELPSYVLSLNAMRNHLTPSQRAMYAGDVAIGAKPGPRGNCTKLGVIQPPTIVEAAKVAKVSTSAVIEAKRIQREAAPEVAQAIRDGNLTVHAATRLIEHVPIREAQPAAVKKVVESNGHNKKKQTVAVLTALTKRLPRKDPVKQFDRVVEALAMSSENLSEIWTRLSEVSPANRDVWADSLRKTRTTLSQVIKSLETTA